MYPNNLILLSRPFLLILLINASSKIGGTLPMSARLILGIDFFKVNKVLIIINAPLSSVMSPM